jgi:alkylation response protein AidB-like acyl-CoA dehydrogenase
MTTTEQDEHADIRDAVAKLCAQFPGEYWRKLDREMAYPKAFVDALTQAGYLSVLIPEEYGGAGLKLSAAAAILEEIQRAGCNGGGCGTAATSKRPSGCRKSPAANCGYRPLASPSRPAAQIPRR